MGSEIAWFKRSRFVTVIMTVGLYFALLNIANAQSPQVAGDVRPYHAESPHPYPEGDAGRPVVWTDAIVSPGAEFLRLRFRGFALAPGDYVTVSNPDGTDSSTYEGRGPKGTGDFWSFSVEGDTAIVEIHAGRRNANGYRIDAVGHGFGPGGGPSLAEPEVICDVDDREDIACHTGDFDDVPEASEMPVARLLFVSGAFQYLCTGWLVDGNQDDLLITNNHCLDTQSEVDTLEAQFNYQYTACGGTTIGSVSKYFGNTLLITNSVDKHGRQGGLDYSLITLDGNPEATWGELTPSVDPAVIGEQIWFIQHPGGRPKEIGYYEDSAGNVCQVHTVDETYGRSAPNSQVGYTCDSEGGSSGSPIIRPDTATLGARAIALHHFGGVGSCLNSGTSMVDICADAGNLLHCEGGVVEPPPPEPQQCINLGGYDLGASCNSNSDCCADKCKGKPGQMTCK